MIMPKRKNYFRSALLILLVVSFTDVYAQIKSGYMIGLNLSSMIYTEKGEAIEPETWAGIHFGGLFEIPVAGGFTIQPGALFSAKSTGYEIDSGQYSIGPIFIEVPIRAVYSFGSEAFKVSFFAGPYFALGIDGLMISPTNTTSMEFGSGYNHDMKPFDMGFNFGMGISIRGLLITGQYGYGMLNLAPVTSDGSEMRNRVWGISFASLFSGKK
jgi:Outer membrane protein beta-barrel domain